MSKEFSKMQKVIDDLVRNGATVIISAKVDGDEVIYSLIAKWENGKSWEIVEIL